MSLEATAGATAAAAATSALALAAAGTPPPTVSELLLNNDHTLVAAAALVLAGFAVETAAFLAIENGLFPPTCFIGAVIFARLRMRLFCATSPCVFPTFERPRFFFVQPRWCPFLY
jgi:hypothetical protein